jgi:hypothetical protein
MAADALSSAASAPPTKEESVADLIAIGYGDEATAAAAAEEGARLSRDLIIEPHAVGRTRHTVHARLALRMPASRATPASVIARCREPVRG